jgi:hypothetical protein
VHRFQSSREGSLCEAFLGTLQRAELLNAHCLDFADLAKWLSVSSLDRVLHYTQAIEDPDLFTAVQE